MSCCSSSLFFVLVALLTIIQQGTCLKCYICKSGRDEPCGYPTPTNGVIAKLCPNSNDICFHIDANVKAEKQYPQYVERGCIAPNSIVCPMLGTSYCTVCDKELCNSNSTRLEAAEFNEDENNDDNDDDGNGGASSSVMTCFIIGSTALLTLLRHM